MRPRSSSSARATIGYGAKEPGTCWPLPRQRGPSRFLLRASPGSSLGIGSHHREYENSVLSVGGVVIRYGQLYGPGTYFETDKPSPPRIHVDEAARRTVPILDAPRGIVEVVEQPLIDKPRALPAGAGEDLP